MLTLLDVSSETECVGPTLSRTFNDGPRLREAGSAGRAGCVVGDVVCRHRQDQRIPKCCRGPLCATDGHVECVRDLASR